MIPGLLGSAYAFRKVIPSLVDSGLQVIVIEPLGVGWSARPGRADYSLTAQSDRIAAVLDTLGGIRCAPVVAHSVSVSIAMRMALRRPDLVCGLVALNGGPVEAAATAGVRKAVKFSFLIKLFGGKNRIRNQVRKGLLETAGDSSWVTPEVLDHYTAGPAGDLGAVMRALKGMVNSPERDSLAPRLASLDIPVHLLIGGAPRGSGIGSGHTALLRERLPVLEVDSIAGAGLYLHEERPDVVVRAVSEMVNTVDHRGSR